MAQIIDDINGKVTTTTKTTTPAPADPNYDPEIAAITSFDQLSSYLDKKYPTTNIPDPKTPAGGKTEDNPPGGKGGSTDPEFKYTGPQYTPVNPTDYTAQYEAARKAKIQSLQAAAERKRQALAERKAGIDPRYANSKTQADVQGQLSASRLAEIMANRGYGTGNQAQRMLTQSAQVQGEVSNLEAQRQSEQDQVARDYQNIDSSLASDISQAESDITADKLKSTIEDQRRVEEANYNRQQQQFTNQMAQKQAESGISAQQAQIEYQKLINAGYSEQEAADLAYKRASTAATEAQTKNIEVDNAWKSVSAIGYVDANASKTLGIPEGTSTLEAQNIAFNQKMEKDKFSWDTNLVDNPQNAAYVQQLSQDKVKFDEWKKQAPQRLAQLNAEVQSATTSNQIADIEKKIKNNELVISNIDKNNKSKMDQLSIDKIKLDMEMAKEELKIRKRDIAVAEKNAETSRINASKPDKTDSTSKGWTEQQIAAKKKEAYAQLKQDSLDPNYNPTSQDIDSVLSSWGVPSTASKSTGSSAQDLYSTADSIPSGNRQQWYNDNKAEIDKYAGSELAAFKAKYGLK